MEQNTLALLTVSFLVVFVVYTQIKKGANKKKVRAAIDAGAVILDVRTPSEYSGGHIEGALNIPMDSLAKKSGKIGGKDTVVVVYCASGSRSSAAVGILRNAGFTVVLNAGGIANLL